MARIQMDVQVPDWCKAYIWVMKATAAIAKKTTVK
jgi:hypothetical protein